MATIVINPADMAERPDFNILNDNVINEVGYSVEDTKYEKEEVSQKSVTVFKSREDYAGEWDMIPALDDNIDLKIYAENVYNYTDYINNNKTNAYHYYIYGYNVSLTEEAKNISAENLIFEVFTETSFIYGAVATPKKHTYLHDSTSYTDIYTDSSLSMEDILNNYVDRDSNGNIISLKQGVTVRIAIRINSDNTLTLLIIELGMIGNYADYFLSTKFAIYHTQKYSIRLKLFQKNTEDILPNSEFSLDSNELNQKNTLIDNTQISQYIANNINMSYSAGKQTATLTCYYCDYYDTDGNLVYSGDNGETISVGDIVLPMIRKNNELVPMSLYMDNTPRQFEVVNSTINYAGKITNTLDIVERPLLYPFELPEELSDISSTISDDKLYICGKSDKYKIYEFNMNNGNWNIISEFQSPDDVQSYNIKDINYYDNFIYFLEILENEINSCSLNINKIDIKNNNTVSTVYTASSSYYYGDIGYFHLSITENFAYFTSLHNISKIDLFTGERIISLTTEIGVRETIGINGNLYLVSSYISGGYNSEIYSFVNNTLSQETLKIFGLSGAVTSISPKTPNSFECNFNGRIVEIMLDDNLVATEEDFKVGTSYRQGNLLIITKKGIRLVISSKNIEVTKL